jgi:hypothetical protein
MKITIEMGKDKRYDICDILMCDDCPFFGEDCVEEAYDAAIESEEGLTIQFTTKKEKSDV